MKDKGIKQLRLELGLSQERFAQLLTVSLQTVRRWESGLTKPLPVISLKLEELQKQVGNAHHNAGGAPMSKKEGKTQDSAGFGLSNMFKGIGNLFELASKMTEEGKEEYSRSGEAEVLGGKGKAVYGFSLKLGLGGKPVIEQFGDIKATKTGAVVAEFREPLVDVIDEGDHLLIIAELPGVQSEDISIEVKGDILELKAEAKDRKYGKEALLPSPVDADSLKSSCKNGVLEIKLKKRK